MKKFLFTFFLLVLSCCFAFALGERCEYAVYGDSQCDPDNGVYCINFVCTQHSGNPAGYCSDSDAQDTYMQGTVMYVIRDSAGNFVTNSSTDYCIKNSSRVESCSTARDCLVMEYYCDPATGQTSSSLGCASGCNNGKCIDSSSPDSWLSIGGTYKPSTFPGLITGGASDIGAGLKKVELLIKRNSDSKYWSGTGWISATTWNLVNGLDSWSYAFSASNLSEGTYSLISKATDKQDNVETSLAETTVVIQAESPAQTQCDYNKNKDAQCDTANKYYCIQGICTQLSQAPSATSCYDSDDKNFFSKGTLTYYYRDFDGKIFSGTKTDSCDGNKNTEYYCLASQPEKGIVYAFETKDCDGVCSNGSCMVFKENKPADEITSVTDTELLVYIQKWSKGELGQTEEENDLKIQEIIKVWKKTK